MKIRPSSQRLLVKLQKPATVSAGGIYIPEAVAGRQKKESEWAEVLAVGPGKLLENGMHLYPCAVPGDVVVLYRGSGHAVEVDGEEFRMVHESEVLGVRAVAEYMPQLFPMNDKVLLKRLVEPEAPAGLILAPDSAKKPSSFAKVLAVGPGRLLKDGTRSPVGVALGVVAVLGDYSGTDVELDGEKYLVVGEEEVLAEKVGEQIGVTGGGQAIYLPPTPELNLSALSMNHVKAREWVKMAVLGAGASACHVSDADADGRVEVYVEEGDDKAVARAIRASLPVTLGTRGEIMVDVDGVQVAFSRQGRH